MAIFFWFHHAIYTAIVCWIQ